MCFKSGEKQLPTHCEVDVEVTGVDVTVRVDVERVTGTICQVFRPYIVENS